MGLLGLMGQAAAVEPVELLAPEGPVAQGVNGTPHMVLEAVVVERERQELLAEQAAFMEEAEVVVAEPLAHRG
jgi:hypothetical protein